MLDRTFEPPAKTPAAEVFEPRAGDPRVVLDLAPRARWVAEQYPMESVQEKGKGRLRVTFVVSETAWLERLLLRLGPDATVVSGAHDIHRGDIVVFKRPPGVPDTGIKDLIKRVIGLPGDTVEAHGGSMYVNGKRLKEGYLDRGTVTGDFPTKTVPKDDIFVMGDNRG